MAYSKLRELNISREMKKLPKRGCNISLDGANCSSLKASNTNIQLKVQKEQFLSIN